MSEELEPSDDVPTTERNVSTPETPDPVATRKATAPERTLAAAPTDTMLSLPAPGDAEEPTVAHFDELRRRVDQLESRFAVMELKDRQAPARVPTWLYSVLFLFGLALAWQLLRR